MTRTIRRCALITGLVLAAGAANAQTPSKAEEPRTRVSLNVGASLNEHFFTTGNSLSIYDETATFNASHRVDQGVLYDVSAARATRWRGLSISGGVAGLSNTYRASMTATVPHPILINRPGTATVDVIGLRHTEVGVHISAVWTVPVSDKTEVAFSLGPSATYVRQDLIQSITVATGTQIPAPLFGNQSGIAWGGNLGADFMYRLTTKYGVGLFVQGVAGNAHLESATVKVTGGQAGLGLRIHF